MAAIDDLIRQIGDAGLRARIAEEVGRLSRQKKFGLVFEEHLPECTPLYEVPVKRGALAARPGEMERLFVVAEIVDGVATCVEKGSGTKEKIPVAELSTVAAFGEPIYPYLKPLDCVENAPSSGLWHTLIEAENYHALQLLDYLYHGKVDCIYIDPPYNTGAKDWKYNNDYVDGNDQYRHSKWLSMMKKRLLLARKLLNPISGVMVLAIDDNELNTLGLLLDEVFDGYKKFCITIVHNPNGNQGKNFGIANEFAYFVLPSGDQILSLENRVDDPDIRPLRDVSGNNNLRTDAKNCFYPIYVKDNQIIGYGDICDNDFHPKSVNVVKNDGIVEVYPIDVKGIEKKWVFARNTVESIANELHVEWNRNRKIFDIIRYKTHFTYKTVWSKKEFNANSHGSKLISKIFAGKRFDYPKSLYAVKECVSAVCANKPNALILDFFAGSGTTLHAVNLLNAEDGGNRRCILVTNNEVSADEAKTLTNKGYKPGDEAWERLGIARYVTWPRTVCSIEGHDVNGAPLKGNYLGNDRPMAEGFAANAAFFHLGFLDKNAVARGTQLEKLLSVLWLKAGAIGKCPEPQSDEKMMVFPENRFAVLVDTQYADEFAAAIAGKDMQTAYIITDYESEYKSIAESLGVPTTYQLYRDYLDNFMINVGRA